MRLAVRLGKIHAGTSMRAFSCGCAFAVTLHHIEVYANKKGQKRAKNIELFTNILLLAFVRPNLSDASRTPEIETKAERGSPIYNEITKTPPLLCTHGLLGRLGKPHTPPYTHIPAVSGIYSSRTR